LRIRSARIKEKAGQKGNALVASIQYLMRSQVKWGLFLILIGILLVPIGFPFLLLYAIPLILIGIAIILFRKREESIEPRKE
jgi:hypothetical protein